MPTIYPSCVVNLILHFEPTLTIAGVGPLAIQGAPPARVGATPAAVRGGHHGHHHAPTSASPAAEAPQQQSYVLDLVPKKCVVEMHGHRQAATFNIVIPWRSLPIDPRTVRSWSAEIHMGTVTAQDFADGVKGERYSSGQTRSILKTQNADGTANENTLMIVGPGDTWKVEYGENGGGEVMLAGRDLRGLLLDSPLTSPNDRKGSHVLDRIDPTNTLDVVIRNLLNEHGRLRDLRVMVDPSEWLNHRIPSPAAINRPRHRRGAHGRTGTTGHSTTETNYWDIIVRYCFFCGAIPHMVGRTLWIRPATALFAHGIDGLANDGVGRNPDTENTTQLVYGRDVTKLTMERKYHGNNKPKVIRCISVNPSGGERGLGQQVIATWPPRAPRTHVRQPQTHQPGTPPPTTPGAPPSTPSGPQIAVPQDIPTMQRLGGGFTSDAAAPVAHGSRRAEHAATTHVSPSGRDPHEELITIRVDGVTDHAQLEQCAKSLYEEIGRNEIDGTVESKHLTSHNSADTRMMDILKLRPGRAVELLVDASQFQGANYAGTGQSRQTIQTTLSNTVSLPFEEAVNRVHQYIRDIQLARVIVATYRGQIMGILRFFRVANVRFEWTASQTEAGINTSIDFQNYFLPRLNITNAPRATGAARGHHQHHTSAPAAPAPGTIRNPGPNDPGGINNPIPLTLTPQQAQGDSFISDAVARQRRRQEGGG